MKHIACFSSYPFANRNSGRAGWYLAGDEVSANAALSACAEKIVKSGGNLDEENVRQTTSFEMIFGFQDMKL